MKTYNNIGRIIGYNGASCSSCASVSEEIGYNGASTSSCASISDSNRQYSKLEKDVLVDPLTKKDKIELKELFQKRK